MPHELTQRERLMKAFARFSTHFAKPAKGRRRMRIMDAPPIVPDTI
jgi:hypothetical protein